MPTYIDPLLYGSLPTKPNTMGMEAVLTDKVDVGLLSEAVESLRERFPYFYVRPQIAGTDLVLAPNDLPVVVRDSWEPTILVSKETNYHVLSFKCEDKRLAAEVMHPVTDGSGFMPYFKSVLFCYLSKRYGIEFDRTGFRLPGDEIPDSETGSPFSEEEVDAVKAPFYVKPEYKHFMQIKEPDSTWRAIKIKMAADEVMGRCKELDASPNALICVLLARAVHKIQPQDEKVILGGIAVNRKAILGNTDNYRCFADLAYIHYKPENLDKDLSLMCTVTRGQVIMQTQPENVLFNLKKMKEGMPTLHGIPSIGAKMLFIGSMAGHRRTTYTVSYAANRTFGPLDPYIEEFYVHAEPVPAAVVVEVSCINNAFFLHFEQRFKSEALLNAFLDELRLAGIEPEVLRKEAYLTSDVRYDDLKIPVVEEAKTAWDGFLASFKR